MNKVNNALASAAVLGVLFSGQGGVAQAAESDTMQPASTMNSNMMQEDMSKPMDNNMMQEDMSQPMESNMMQEDMSKPMDNNMMQNDMSKPMDNNMMQEDMSQPMESNMMQEDMSQPMDNNKMKMLPDTGETDRTNILFAGGALVMGLALSVLGFKRKRA